MCLKAAVAEVVAKMEIKMEAVENLYHLLLTQTQMMKTMAEDICYNKPKHHV
jgi:hypothetical protein